MMHSPSPMMSPLALSDEELDVLTQLAAPLPVSQRDVFLRDVASEMSKCSPQSRGPGLTFRIASAVQKRFFNPPTMSEASTSIGKRSHERHRL